MKNHNNEILIEIVNKFIEKDIDNPFLLHIFKNYPDINWEAKQPEITTFMFEALEQSKSSRIERKKDLLELTHYLMDTNKLLPEKSYHFISFFVKNDYTEMIQLLFTQEDLKRQTIKVISDNNMVSFFKPRMLELFANNEELKKNTYLSVFDLRNAESVVKALNVQWGDIHERNTEGKNLIDTTIEKLSLIKKEDFEENSSNNAGGQYKYLFEILRLAEGKLFNDNIETFLKSLTIKSIKPTLFKNLHSEFLSNIDMNTRFSYKEKHNLDIIQCVLSFINDKDNNIQKEVAINNKFLAIVSSLKHAFSKISDQQKIENIIETLSTYTNRNNLLGEFVVNVVSPSGLKETEKQNIFKKEFIDAITNNAYNKAIYLHKEGLSQELSQEILKNDVILKNIFKNSQLCDYFTENLEESVKERCYIKMIYLYRKNKSITDNVIKELSQYSSDEYHGMKQILLEDYPKMYNYFFHEKDGRFVKNKKASVMDEKFQLTQQMQAIEVHNLGNKIKNRL